MTNSPISSPETSASPNSIRLVVKGFHVPSFKNSKMLTRGRLITKPEYQQLMKQITQAFECQLRSWFQTNGIETGTGRTALLRIASLLPLDDSLKWIAEHCVKWQRVSKGNEGAELKVEKI